MAGAEGSPTARAGAEMDIEFSVGSWGPSFEFAFDAENFSDKLLRIEVVASGNVAGARDPVEEVLQVKTMYINSAILAARSPFFLKLFSNGMKESDQTHPTLRIADSDENALMELLSFIYSGKLTTTEPTFLLDILMAADKFQVISCMRHCYQLLTSLPLTTESALLYLDHPCSMSMAAEVQLLKGAAKEFLVNKYKDYNKFQHEVMNFSLAGIEAILSSTDLYVQSEDFLYYLLVKWARVRYPELEERRKILSSHLLPLVRFSHMTYKAFQSILTCTDNDIDHEHVTKLITGVLLCKAYPAHKPGALAACATSCLPVAERAYKYRHMKVVAFDKPCPQVIAYMDLKREECSLLKPIFSYPFHVAGQGFILMARCNKDEQSDLFRFGLFLCIDPVLKGSRAVTVEYEFAARTRPRQFVSKFNASETFTDGVLVGCDNIFLVPWSTFMADDDLFIHGVLHLRVDLTVVEQTELQA
ncbi:BTB/POZ domain-containing protein POB1-like [Lolium rigidum]|uniref:BTB/POZ domain-containing protein POB1-like n=1 Tax=Lolium rigidum TaxID=89674 RepID=UPI001F5D4A17|nr:BTB/POZ domain-containing protein POB1-like [Lolium rigidum]